VGNLVSSAGVSRARVPFNNLVNLSRKNMDGMGATESRLFLALMALIFACLCVTIALDPDAGLGGHGLSFVDAEPAARAEIRAFYGGCFGCLALVCARAVSGGGTARRRDALDAVCCLLALFASIRVYSYAADGPPARTSVYRLWAAEVLGAAVAGYLAVGERLCCAIDDVVGLGAALLPKAD
jgi:hypothetical protein